MRDVQPNVVLSRAIHAGLAALVRLARLRVNRKTARYYKSIEKMWVEARQALKERPYADRRDFSAIQNKEPNMRGMFLKIVWESTRRHGNEESKRVYSWREGTVGPLNSLLNFAGARLRDLAMTRYPFPEPEYFQVRRFADGSKRVYRKNAAE